MEKIHAGCKSKLSKHFCSICMTQNQNGLETLTEKALAPKANFSHLSVFTLSSL